MTIVPMIVSLICFYGDGNPLTDLCASTFEVDTVIECPARGDSTVPLHISSGAWNPGPGQASFHATLYSGAQVVGSDLLLSTPFDWRGSRQEAGYFIVNYGVPFGDEVTFLGDFEGCVCHTRSPQREAACEAAARG